MAHSVTIQTMADWLENGGMLATRADIGFDFVQGNGIGAQSPWFSTSLVPHHPKA
jgi:hypothetical protein